MDRNTSKPLNSSGQVVESNSSAVAQLSNFLFPQGVGTNEKMISISNTVDERMVHDLVDNYTDILAVSGDIISLSSNVAQVNQTARDVIFMPETFRNLTAMNPAYKLQLTPPLVTFNDSGLLPTGSTTAELLTGAGAYPAGQLLGWAFRIIARDTLKGTVQVTISSAEGVTSQVKLRDVSEEGWVVVLAHKQADNFNTTAALVSVPPLDTYTYGSGVAAVTQQYVFTPDSFPGVKMTLTGLNANVDAYPIPLTREMLALVGGLYFADKIELSAQAILTAYKG